MPHKPKSENEIIEKVVNLNLTLIQSLRSTPKLKFEEISRLFYRESLYPGIEQEQKIVRQIIDLIQVQNPQISKRLIFSTLISETVGYVIFNPYDVTSDSEYAEKTREQAQKLLEYSSSREIDIPLVNLEIDGQPFKIGNVTLLPITDEVRKSEWWEKVKANYPERLEYQIHSFGRVSCQGDSEIAREYAISTIDETLQIIRGLGFPFVNDDLNQVGVLNEFPTWKNIPLWSHLISETYRLDNTSGVVTRLGPKMRTWRLYSDIIANIDGSIIEKTSVLMSNQLNLSDMQRKLIFGLRWIGEAIKPDILPSKYLKLATALEYLIGGEPRGVTASLAERAAFLVSDNLDERLKTDKAARDYYNLRSKLIHGSSTEITFNDFKNLGELVRRIAIALYQKESNFADIRQFQEWVNMKRYS